MYGPFTTAFNLGVALPIRASAFTLSATDIITVGDAGTVVASFDGGGSWKPLYAPTADNLHATASVYFAGANHVVVAGENGALFYGDVVHDDIFQKRIGVLNGRLLRMPPRRRRESTHETLPIPARESLSNVAREFCHHGFYAR